MIDNNNVIYFSNNQEHISFAPSTAETDHYDFIIDVSGNTWNNE